VCGPCREDTREYGNFHRDPASRRRRRKGKSKVWESKIWPRVPRDSDPRKTVRAEASSIYKRQTRPLVREGAPQKQDRNYQTVINIWLWAPDGARLTDWPSVAMRLWLGIYLKYRRLKLGGGQAYDRSSNWTAVVAGATNDRAWSAVLNLDWQDALHMLYIHTYTYIYINSMENVSCTCWQQTLLLAVTLAKDRPVLSSKRAPHINKPETVWQ
jgi:hypothetical protein